MQSAPLGSNNIVFITLYFQTKWFRGITELFFSMSSGCKPKSNQLGQSGQRRPEVLIS